MRTPPELSKQDCEELSGLIAIRVDQLHERRAADAALKSRCTEVGALNVVKNCEGRMATDSAERDRLTVIKNKIDRWLAHA